MDDVDVGRGVVVPARELRFRFTRASGPGGQNVNKRSTRAELIFDVAASDSLSREQKRRARARLASRLDAEGRLRLVVDEARTQSENRRLAVERFARVMSDALRPPPPPRKPTRPSASARERRLSEKRARGELKAARRRPDAED